MDSLQRDCETYSRQRLNHGLEKVQKEGMVRRRFKDFRRKNMFMVVTRALLSSYAVLGLLDLLLVVVRGDDRAEDGVMVGLSSEYFRTLTDANENVSKRIFISEAS